MNASKVVELLQNRIGKYGDKPVRFHDGSGDSDIAYIREYDNRGNKPKNIDDCEEFFIHS